MASKKKEIRKATRDGVVTKKEQKGLTAAGISQQRVQNFQSKRQAVANVGTKFNKKDFKSLSNAGLGSNQILKIAASSNKVGSKANNKLMGLNPGIKLPAAGVNRPMMGGNANYGAIGQYSQSRIQAGEQLKGKKNYYQWQGTTAKGKPNALGGFKVPNKGKGSPYSLGNKAYKGGAFTGLDGGGSFMGRDGSSVLRNNGKMKNQPASWMPGGSGGGGGGRNRQNKEGGGEFAGMDTASFEDPSTPAGGPSLSGVFGGEGAAMFGSPNFRRRRSRAQRSGSYTQGPSQLGINLQRKSGLSIMQA
jgi:hypothetical protein